jgi:tetratricopeptide (TPR) repeat protein
MRVIHTVLLALLAIPLAALGQSPRPQARVPLQGNPTDLVNQWYQHFMDRPLDPLGAANWPRELAQGRPPADVLSEILGSGEYYLRAGNTPQGFARGLIRDLTGQEPDPRLVREWAARVNARNHREIARALLERYPQGWRGPTAPAPAPYVGYARDEVQHLTSALQLLQEDLRIELRGPKERELYNRADEVLGDLRHFRRSLQAGVEREHLYRDFRTMDRKLHDLIGALAERTERRPGLNGSLSRVERADNALHQALSIGDNSANRVQEVILRQARSLELSARALNNTAGYVLHNSPRARETEQAIAQFAEAAEHFRKSLRANADQDHLRHDFRDVNRAWYQASQRINALPPGQGNRSLRRQAQETDESYQVLFHYLKPEGDRARIIYPLGRVSR